MARRALGLWLAIVAAESLLGALRERFVAPALGDLPARQLGVPLGCVAILAIATAGARWLRAETTRAQLAVGAVWVGLTIAFELALGRGVLHASWSRIAADYDPRRGGFLAFGMLVLGLAPLLAARWRGRR